MQEIKNAAAVFCTACICAEIVSQLLGGTRMRTCIKAVAGLYILVSVLQALPGLGAQAQAFTLPQTPAASFGSLEETVLRQTSQQLARELEARVLAQTGCEVRLDVTLCRDAQGAVSAEAVRVLPAQAYTAGQQEQIAALLRQALAAEPEDITFIHEEDVP